MSPKLSPNLEPGTRRFLEQVNAQGGKPIYELSPVDARKVLSDLQAGKDVEKLPADIEDRMIPGGPGNQDISIRIVRPKGQTDVLPVIMHFHGGGWVLGGKDTHDRLVRELANGAQAAVVFVDYTPAPDAQFPVQIEQAYAATKWIAENGESLGMDPSRLAILGDSVGGNMAAVVALLAKERGGPRIASQVLFYPVTDANFDTGTYQEFATGYFLARDGMRWFWDNYLPNVEERARPHASPLRASLEELKGLPPALVIVGEHDVLRDEGEAYAHKLAEAGVRVEATRFLGTMHDFVMLNPITDTPAPRAAIRLATETLRRVFGEVDQAGRRTALGAEATAPMQH
ncbi:alpha/beta hydrolase [Pyxidicoccus caerfyrddinensis]|uniref:alpha/beta hydrolase n=1 Tax=Pyxidicoccus caerfyrddinensis TaxID=2709663 RepID=UPI0013DD7F18|nr:alpha/beta hydrolase [Pyxidicoccus caerfyrddinensis]